MHVRDHGTSQINHDRSFTIDGTPGVSLYIKSSVKASGADISSSLQDYTQGYKHVALSNIYALYFVLLTQHTASLAAATKVVLDATKVVLLAKFA